MQRAELNFLEDGEHIVAQFTMSGAIHIPLVHGKSTLSNIAVVMLSTDRMLVGRHMHGAMIFDRVEDFQKLRDPGQNGLSCVPMDAPGLADLLEHLYMRRHCCERSPSFVETGINVEGRTCDVYVVEDIIDCFAPYQGWSKSKAAYVAIIGIGSWLTPFSHPLTYYADDYIAEKTGMWALPREEQQKNVAVLKGVANQ